MSKNQTIVCAFFCSAFSLFLYSQTGLKTHKILILLACQYAYQHLKMLHSTVGSGEIQTPVFGESCKEILKMSFSE